MAGHRSLEVYWDEKACLESFSYTYPSGEVLTIPAGELTFVKRNADDGQMIRMDRAVSVNFKPEPQKTLEDALAAVSAVYGPLPSFPDQSDAVPIGEDEIDEEDALRDLQNLTCITDCDLSAM